MENLTVVVTMCSYLQTVCNPYLAWWMWSVDVFCLNAICVIHAGCQPESQLQIGILHNCGQMTHSRLFFPSIDTHFNSCAVFPGFYFFFFFTMLFSCMCFSAFTVSYSISAVGFNDKNLVYNAHMWLWTGGKGSKGGVEGQVYNLSVPKKKWSSCFDISKHWGFDKTFRELLA